MKRALLSFAVVAPLGVAAAMLAGCQRAAETPEAANATTADTARHAAGGAAVAELRPKVDAVADPYLELRRLLAEDQFEGVPERFAEIREAAQPLIEAGGGRVEGPAGMIAESAAVQPENLEQAREAFAELSTPMIELVEAVPPSGDVADAFHVAYCPMAKASWLQTSEEISNPYMGQEMPKCGEIQRTIETQGI